MTPKIKEKSLAYRGIGTGVGGSDSGSDSLAGIGTRISAAADAIGSRKSAAEVMQVSTDSLQRYIRGEVQAPFLAVARLAMASRCSLQWIASGREHAPVGGAAATSQDLSGEALMVSHELAEEALRGLWLPKPRFFDLVALIHSGVTQGLPYAEIIDFARSEASKLAKERASDGSEQGVGGAGEGGAGGGKAGAPGQGDW